jgi:SNF2 family DNA or RNA helicase
MELHPFQKRIINECVEKQRGGLSLPMGSGKTIIALRLSLENKIKHRPILIVVSKTLIGSWEQEITKWYPDLKFKTLLLSDDFSKDDDIILTTPTTLVKYYKKYNIEEFLFEKRRDSPFGPETIYYNEVDAPMLNTSYDTFYSVTFSYLIVDEAHNYLNINTLTCRSLISIRSTSKWLLSGTLFSEPKDSNILGFLRMCDCYKNFPNNLPYMTRLMKRGLFPGIDDYIVKREDNEMFVNRPTINKNIVKYEMNKFELNVYQIYRDLIKRIYKKLGTAKMFNNREQVKHLNATLLSMILKLRLCLISPMLVISKMYIDNIDNGNSKGIFGIIKEVFEENNILQELHKEENLNSTRISKIIEKIKSHPGERVLVFSSFKMTLNYLEMILKREGIDRKVYSLNADMSVKKREKIIEEYSKVEGAILLMTYTIGCEGLNLQSASVVMIMDVWWNEAKSRQAIARVYRFGQKRETHVYMFMSNTYIEHVMFQKHKDKASIADELLEGKITTKVTQISLKKIVDILSTDNFDYNTIIRSI